MGDETPGRTPEGRLIDEAARASGRSARALAANAGMSDTRWRQVVKGWQPGPAGQRVAARASATSLARMAIAVGLTPNQLEEAGREDAAEQQRRIMNAMVNSSVVPLTVGAVGDQVDEIDLIYASNMPAREKLLRISQVLRLREQAEAEEAQAREEASAAGAEASVDNPQT